MTDTAQALTEAALKLPPEDRERRVETPIASLDHRLALHPDWHDEIDRPPCTNPRL